MRQKALVHVFGVVDVGKLQVRIMAKYSVSSFSRLLSQSFRISRSSILIRIAVSISSDPVLATPVLAALGLSNARGRHEAAASHFNLQER